MWKQYFLACLTFAWISYKLQGADAATTPTRERVYKGREIGFFNKKQVLYAQAVKGCASWNGRLVNIKDNATMQFIIDNMPVRPRCSREFYYIGLYRKPKIGWEWSDNTPLSSTHYTNWRQRAPGEPLRFKEPNGRTGNPLRKFFVQDAVQIWACHSTRRNKIGAWYDKPQSSSRWFFICERPYKNISDMTTKFITNESTTVQTSTSPTQETTTIVGTKESSTTLFASTTQLTSEALQTNSKSITSSKIVTETPKPTNETVLGTTAITSQSFISINRNLSIKHTSSNVRLLPSAVKMETTKKPVASSVSSSTQISYKCILSYLLYSDDGHTEELCDLDGLFGENFNISLWENQISEALARAFLTHNSSTNELDITRFSGIIIKLYKFQPGDNLDEIFKTENKSKGTIELHFTDESPNKLEINKADLKNVQGSFAIVAADISPELWQHSDLENASPARPITAEDASQNNIELNRMLHVLPSNASILSFSMYLPQKEGKYKKRSIPTQPFVNVNTVNTLLPIKSESQKQIALNGITYACVFLDISETSNYTWSQFGCNSGVLNDGAVHCKCNHSTSFGVILAVRMFQVPLWATSSIIVLEVFTILALLLAIILLFWLRKKLHSDRTILQINLATSLFFLHLFFILGDFAAKDIQPYACETFAVLSQYFTLTTASWFLNEGIVLYFKTYKNALSFNLKKVFPYLAGAAWGLPAVYVAVCASVGLHYGIYLEKNQVYGPGLSPKYERCWLSVSSKMIYAVVVPLIIILLITTGIVVKIAIAINTMNKEVKNLRPSGKYIKPVENQSIKKTNPSKKKANNNNVENTAKAERAISKRLSIALKAVLLLLPVLGVPWILAFFVNIPRAEVVFLMLNGLINGLQGVFVCYIYCIRSSHFRKVFNRQWSKIILKRFRSDTHSSKQTKVQKQNHKSSNL